MLSIIIFDKVTSRARVERSTMGELLAYWIWVKTSSSSETGYESRNHTLTVLANYAMHGFEINAYLLP